MTMTSIRFSKRNFNQQMTPKANYPNPPTLFNNSWTCLQNRANRWNPKINNRQLPSKLPLPLSQSSNYWLKWLSHKYQPKTSKNCCHNAGTCMPTTRNMRMWCTWWWWGIIICKDGRKSEDISSSCFDSRNSNWKHTGLLLKHNLTSKTMRHASNWLDFAFRTSTIDSYLDFYTWLPNVTMN